MNHAEAAAKLEAVLTAENDALRRHDAAAAAALLKEKLSAAAALDAAGVDFDLGERLRTLAIENRRLLEQAMQVQGEIISMVVRAAQATQPAIRYGAEGRTLQPDGALALARQA